MEGQQRITWFDSAKGFAIVLVVYGHVLHEVFKTGLHPVAGFCLWSDYVVYSFPMPVFFFISGVLLTGQIAKRETKALLWGKVNTIIYPYIIWSMIQGGVEVVFSGYTGSGVSFSELLRSLFWQPRAQFWFLHVLFFMNVTTILLHRLSRKNGTKVLLAIALALYFFAPPNLQGFEANLIFFAVGFWIGRERMVSFPQHLTNRIFILVAVLFVALEYVTISNDLVDNRVAGLLVSFCGILFTFLLSVKLNTQGISRLVKVLGEKSMPIYLMHVLVYKIVFILLFALQFNNYILFLLAGVLAGVAVSFYGYILLERYGFSRLFRVGSSAKLIAR